MKGKAHVGQCWWRCDVDVLVIHTSLLRQESCRFRDDAMKSWKLHKWVKYLFIPSKKKGNTKFCRAFIHASFSWRHKICWQWRIFFCRLPIVHIKFDTWFFCVECQLPLYLSPRVTRLFKISLLPQTNVCWPLLCCYHVNTTKTQRAPCDVRSQREFQVFSTNIRAMNWNLFLDIARVASDKKIVTAFFYQWNKRNLFNWLMTITWNPGWSK